MISFNDAKFFESAHSIHEWISHELEQFKIHQHWPLITYKQEREGFLKKITRFCRPRAGKGPSKILSSQALRLFYDDERIYQAK